MKRTPLLLILIGLTTFVVFQWRSNTVSPAQKAAVASLPWLTDFDAARARSEAENKPLFMDFTGSDWCPPCMRLRKEVFATPEFAQYAKDRLVLLEVDFPRREPLPAAQRSANESLARQFQVAGFPTIIVLSPAGVILGQLGYTPGGPDAFLAELDQILSRG